MSATCRDCGTQLVDPGSKRCRACYRKAGTRRNEGRSSAAVLVCSFCGKTQREVRIVAGSSANICNECVALCVYIIGDLPSSHEQRIAEVALSTWASFAMVPS